MLFLVPIYVSKPLQNVSLWVPLCLVVSSGVYLQSLSYQVVIRNWLKVRRV